MNCARIHVLRLGWNLKFQEGIAFRIFILCTFSMTHYTKKVWLGNKTCLSDLTQRNSLWMLSSYSEVPSEWHKLTLVFVCFKFRYHLVSQHFLKRLCLEPWNKKHCVTSGPECHRLIYTQKYWHANTDDDWGFYYLETKMVSEHMLPTIGRSVYD